MSVQQSVRSYLGIAKEATRGTAVAPTDFIPVMKDNLKPVDIVDPLYEWPLGQRTIGKFIEAKYSSPSYANTSNTGVTGLEWATNNTQAYYKIETRTDTSTGLYRQDRIRLDANTYANVVISETSYSLGDGTPLKIVVSKETKSYYEYENELNENKRNITILKPEFVIDIEAEFKSVMKDSI